MYNDLYPANTRAKFSSSIHPSCLQYIPSGRIEAAVKNITFDNSRLIPMNSIEYLGIKSNISDYIISSGCWDNLLYTFNIDSKSDNLVNIDIKNPTFFSTTTEKLAEAKFEIINLETNTAPEFAVGTPTFITITVKQQPDRMKQPFHILLDSSCSKSKTYFPSNINTDFSIKLPKRMEFKKDWIVALKSISFSNNLYNVYDCFITVEKDAGKAQKFMIEDGKYDSIDELIKEINLKMGAFLVFMKNRAKEDEVIIARRSSLMKSVLFSKNLAKIFNLPSDYSPSHFQQSSVLKSKVTLTQLIPQHFIICCDMVEHSILGGQQVQVLRLVNKTTNSGKFNEYEFYNNDYVKLGLKEFDKIRIRILTVGGTMLKCDPTLPTRLQLLFVNTNSR